MYLGLHADRHPDRVAIRMEDSPAEVLTYGQLEAASNQCAHAWQALGLQPGDVVAIMLENCVEWAVAWWGAMRSGLYLTPVNWHLISSEVEYILANSGAKVLISGVSTAADARQACAQHPGIAHVQVGLGSGASGPGLDFWTLLNAQPATRIARELAGAAMFYSSGTTGKPKGIRPTLPGRPPGEVPSLPYSMMLTYGVREGDVYLNTAPLYHTAPACFTFGAHAVGATSVVMRRFDAERALALIESQQVTVSQWVPTMFQRLLRLDEATRARYDLSRLRTAVHAAAPCPPSAKRAMIDWWGPVLLEYYGSTEAGATVISSQEWLDHPGSVGRPWPDGPKMAVLDVSTRQPVPPGREGLIYFEPLGSHRIEYFKDPERTRELYHDGMIATGDIGRLDEDGFLYLTDRVSDVIISGGVNIYPREIEFCLGEHPAVLDVAVFGIPDAEFGEQVMAVIQPAADAGPGPELGAELTQWCRERLAGYKVPRAIDFVTDFPREENGKLYKRRLRDGYWKDHESRLI